MLLALAGTGWSADLGVVTGFAPGPGGDLDFACCDRRWAAGIRSGWPSAHCWPRRCSPAAWWRSRCSTTRIGVWQAVLTSWRAVLASPAPLAFWAAVLLAITFAGMATPCCSGSSSSCPGSRTPAGTPTATWPASSGTASGRGAGAERR
ncbi:MAG: hypothetical protein U1F67_19925 [Rubrivivax sp.]